MSTGVPGDTRRDSEPLTGEPVALDLVNTRPAGANGREDLLGTPQQLAAWLALETDRLHGVVQGATPTPADLAPSTRSGSTPKPSSVHC